MNVEDEVHLINNKLSVLSGEVRSRLTSIEASIERLVTRHEFNPVKLIVYGICACILTGVVAALLSRILIK